MNRSLALRNDNRNSFFKDMPLFFKVAFFTVLSFIAVVFVFTIVMMTQMFMGINNGGYSYKVDYQVGNSHYSQESSWGN